VDSLSLTKQEMKVYKLLLDLNLSTNDIADKLFVTHKAIRFHGTNIYKKLKVKSRRELLGQVYNKNKVNNKTETIKTEGLPMGAKQSNMQIINQNNSSLDAIDQKFKVGEVINHLHSMMKGVTKDEMNPATVMAACQCVSKMNEVMNTTMDAARFLRSNG